MTFAQTYPRLRNCLFIVTYGRSGSTVLQRMLQTLPDSHIVGENAAAFEGVYHTMLRLRWAKQKMGRSKRPASHPWYGVNAMDLPGFGAAAAAGFVQHVLGAPASARYVGFKEIRYFRLRNRFDDYLDFMWSVFPGATFVFLTRPWEDCAQSSWYASWPRERVKSRITGMDARFRAYEQAHPERCFSLTYDEMCADPLALEPLFDRLDAGIDPRAIEAILAERLPH